MFDHLQFYSQLVSDGVINVRDVVDEADWNAKAKVVVFSVHGRNWIVLDNKLVWYDPRRLFAHR